MSTIHAILAVAAALYTIWFDEAFANPPSGSLAIAASFIGVIPAALTLSYVSPTQTIYPACNQFCCLSYAKFVISLLANTVPGSSFLTAAFCRFSYWIYDLTTTLVFWSYLGDYLMLIHHLVGIFPFTLGMYRSELIMYASFIILTEISTPFVNNRWFFATLGWGSSKLYVYNGVAMWFAFLCSRLLWIPYMVYDFYHNWHFILQTMALVWVPTMFGTAVTFLLSSYWFFLITKGMLKAVGLLPASSSKKTASSGDKKKKAN